MNPDDQQRAVLTVCLMAAFADGVNSEHERDEIRRIAGRLGQGAPIDVGALHTRRC